VRILRRQLVKREQLARQKRRRNGGGHD
jgi:hypothetical protein